MTFTLKPGELTLADIHRLYTDSSINLALDHSSHAAISASEQTIQFVIDQKKTAYGINTGFGALANTRIPTSDLHELQRSIVLSHAAGVGEHFTSDIVRLILLLKINSLARGYSGVRLETIEALIKLFNAHVYPCIPSQGSVGASGDLAPLAHLSAILIGEGEAYYQGKILSAKAALQLAGIKPLVLAPKEGLALLNGTQVSTALALAGLFAAQEVFVSALGAGALSVDAARASDQPFDARIQAIRGHAGQIKAAKILRELLANSEIRQSHAACEKVQDPYSLRCQPQVMGACLTQLDLMATILLTEANAVSDNPLIFAEDDVILSGGNFHAEPIALAADAIATAIAEIGALSERRIALLIDPHFSQLPAFLVPNPGVNSGFMLAQVTAAALASENKSLAHPASVDSIPTSANQEDHVSMATFGARRLLTMAKNTASIVAIELLAAAQGIDFLRPLKTSPRLEQLHALIRDQVAFYDKDRYIASDIAKIIGLVQRGTIRQTLNLSLEIEET
jgi:histidine ammonia-lyase